MSWTNYHSHTHYSDGKFEPEAYVQQAIAIGLKAYGFSCHSPFEGGHGWNMNPDRLKNYCEEILVLKEKYKSKIQLYLGLEVDFIPDVIGPKSAHILESHLDFTIGSIHYTGTFADGRYCEIDGPHQFFLEGLNKIYGGNVKLMIRTYYQLMREMLEQETPTILGHMDKIKIQNEGGHLFGEDELWYQNEVEKTLDLVKAKGVIIEVNTRGIYKGITIEPYPSKAILEQINAKEIPIMLNSDAHLPGEIDKGFRDTAKLLKNMGFQQMMALVDGKFKAFEFNENGLIF
ncbi:histidinol-phosphatase [Flexithrix dorotheae]|uniref:histidinol-phosphatase n=1 Tax=Flexithrix dorotheae TaxID=70993 RepID=UPI000368A2A3|nr:histidinol-phosphatase [Flexithrix dorotheae]